MQHISNHLASLSKEAISRNYVKNFVRTVQEDLEDLETWTELGTPRQTTSAEEWREQGHDIHPGLFLERNWRPLCGFISQAREPGNLRDTCAHIYILRV